ncbi:hypothetical protein [Shewanella nanhaiensis]|uniref:Uncharacterized protein n=1 Tax=Shewanella nanhaiensis TaxID=2864872 RepID=A0ABS7E9M8_9GAMM|nr:hypothetical protein [Shewanella nanhaiensis]MBW8186320.1 hypothetical protein [Shewanella nanhaiensis]
MATNIKFINNSTNKNLFSIIITAKNNISTFDMVTDGIAWRVLKNIGRGSQSSFKYNSNYSIRAGWDNGENVTSLLKAQTGKKYQVTNNNTGIILQNIGNTNSTEEIELINNIKVDDGVLAQIFNDNKIIMGKKSVGYGQSAVFKPSNKLYWGIASEIDEGKGLSSKSAVLNSNSFFELDLDGISDALVSLNGNAKDGFFFQTEYQK